MSLLQELHLENMNIHALTVSKSWSALKTLNLDRNAMSQLPKKLSCLCSLEYLSAVDQEADLQITEPLLFLTQLQNLSMVDLAQAESEQPVWNENSFFALMQGRLCIKNTPGCNIALAT